MSNDPKASHLQDAVCLSMLNTLLAAKREGSRVVDPWWDNVPLPSCEHYLEIYLTASRVGRERTPKALLLRDLARRCPRRPCRGDYGRAVERRDART